MKYILLNSLLIMIISSCTQPGEKTTKIMEATIQDTTVSDHALLPGCFRMIIGKDTADLNLILRDSIVTGSLTYNRFEKDDSRGELQGVIRENTLRAWYRFQSEGTISVNEVIFKIDNNTLSEGYGDMEQLHDTVIFKYPSSLRYETNHPYTKIDCR
jgi:hypothetical protein